MTWRHAGSQDSTNGLPRDVPSYKDQNFIQEHVVLLPMLTYSVTSTTQSSYWKTSCQKWVVAYSI